ncbi:MAG: helix-turn-helix transcriptional regulator [Gemmatimonadales bacterium]
MLRLRVLFVAALATSACSHGSVPTPATERSPGPRSAGERLFVEATFDGNGRTCATCHDLEAYGTLTPERVRALWAADPAGPLFRPIDSDDGLGRLYERLREHATVRVPLALEADPATGLAVRRCDAPLERTVVLSRGVPTVFNVSLDGNLMSDGREEADLDRQAGSAVATHAQLDRTPTADELASIAAFERTLFSNQAIPDAFIQGAILTDPPGITESEIRGRAFLAPDRQCGICHSGPLFNRTSARHPDAISFDYASTLVGQEPDNPNPKHEWCFFDPSVGRVVTGPNGSERVFDRPTADPGAAILPGSKVFVDRREDRLDTIPNAELAARVGPLFKIPMLWGVADTAPYFHDNSAKTLEDVVDQYNFLFEQRPALAAAAGCVPGRVPCLDERDRADIVAYLRLLSFDGLGVRSEPIFGPWVSVLGLSPEGPAAVRTLAQVHRPAGLRPRPRDVAYVVMPPIAPALDRELKKGSAELIVLSIVEGQARHGYEIGKLIESRSRGRLRFHVASLYPLLYRLEERGWLQGRWVEKPGERRRRFYGLTPKGRRELARQREAWKTFVDAMTLITAGEHA